MSTQINSTLEAYYAKTGYIAQRKQQWCVLNQIQAMVLD